jgi:hypothetical protein
MDRLGVSEAVSAGGDDVAVLRRVPGGPDVAAPRRSAVQGFGFRKVTIFPHRLHSKETEYGVRDSARTLSREWQLGHAGTTRRSA